MFYSFRTCQKFTSAAVAYASCLESILPKKKFADAYKNLPDELWIVEGL